MINKALDYLQRLFAHLADIDFNLSDLDANSFIPYLVLKVREGCVCERERERERERESDDDKIKLKYNYLRGHVKELDL